MSLNSILNITNGRITEGVCDVKVIEPVAVALDKLQGEKQACLPTLTATESTLDELLSKRLMYCKPLVTATVMCIKKRFESWTVSWQPHCTRASN